MRYDKSIYFQKVTDKVYDEETGNYEDEVTETLRHAHIANTSSDASSMIYGIVRNDSLTIVLNIPYEEPFDYIRIGEDKYVADRIRIIGHKQSIVAHGGH